MAPAGRRCRAGSDTVPRSPRFEQAGAPSSRCHDYKDIIYAGTKPEIEVKRKALIRKWRLKCPAVAASLEEAGDKLFTLTRFPKSQWKSIRTSNAIERLHEEFKRRIKDPRPCCLPRKLPRCCYGPCWLLAKSRCRRWTVGKASPRSLPIKSLTLPHDQIS
jgi:Transposase, Mutator family